MHEPVTLLTGVTVGNFAFWADSLLVAVLLYYGANSFKRVTEVNCNNQLPYIFQVPQAFTSSIFARKGWRSYFIERGEVLGEARLLRFLTTLPSGIRITKHMPATN